MMACLRAATRPAHDHLETNLDILNACRTPEAYQALLARFYGFYAPLEEDIAAHFRSDEIGFHFAPRRKTPLLVQDLLALGLTPTDLERLPRAASLPLLTSASQLFGCLYVLEGATLGGQVIRKHLGQIGDRDLETATAFFSSYGEQVGRMWKDFGNALDRYAAAAPDADSIIEAAAQTFSLFDLWLTRGHAQ